MWAARLVGKRVAVPWEIDGEGVAYAGEVIDVRGTKHGVPKLRVKLDEGAGASRLRCHTVAWDEVTLLD